MTLTTAGGLPGAAGPVGTLTGVVDLRSARRYLPGPLVRVLLRCRAAAADLIAREELERLRQELNRVRADLQDQLEQRTRELLDREDTVLATYDQRVAAIANRVLDLEERREPTGQDDVDANRILAGHGKGRASSIDPGLGPPHAVADPGRPALVERAKAVLSVVAEHSPVLDLGRANGEALELLHDAGIPASGIYRDPAAAADLRRVGLDASAGDPLIELAGWPDAAVGAVTAVGLVEHLDLVDVDRLFRAVRRVLRPGGVVAIETTYPESELSMTAFWRDPTRVRPYDEQALRWLAERSGLEVTDVHRSPPEDDAYFLVARRI